MKKVFFISMALIVLCTPQLNAQSKESAKALKDLSKAKEATIKKSDKADAWLKLGEAYANCYDAPIFGVRLDQTQIELKTIFLKDQPVIGNDEREVLGLPCIIDIYSDKEIWYTEEGLVWAFKVTKPLLADEDALEKSLEAFKKAEEIGGVEKDLKVDVEALARRHFTEALCAYRMGDNNTAMNEFELSYIINSEPVVGEVDTLAIYYTGIAAQLCNDDEKAIKYFTLCKEIGYEEEGDVYGSLAESYKHLGDTLSCKEVLAEGFTKYPTSQGILVSLINIYLETKDDPNKVLEVIHAAQTNEPTNASLYYAEAGVYKNLGDNDKAIELYKKAMEVDPNYMYAPWALGELYYSMGFDIQEKASMEPDDAVYAQMLKELDECLQNAKAPFEIVFKNATDPDMKRYSAEYLKNICFRYRDESTEAAADYDKYQKFIEEFDSAAE